MSYASFLSLCLSKIKNYYCDIHIHKMALYPQKKLVTSILALIIRLNLWQNSNLFCVLVIYKQIIERKIILKKETKRNTKEETIKFRVTLNEKKKIQHLSNSKNMTLSGYILQTCLSDTPKPPQITERIEVCNFINEIYHEVKKYGNKQLTDTITSLCKKYVSNLMEV